MTMIDSIWNWLANNYEWAFGGIGVAVLVGIVGIARKRSGGSVQKQSSGDNSTNIQGRDINVDLSSKPSDDE